MRKIFILFLSVFCLQQAFAAADTIRLDFDHFAQGPKYYNSGDWYVVLENEEDWEVYLNWKAPKPKNATPWSIAYYEEWCNIRYKRCSR